MAELITAKTYSLESDIKAINRLVADNAGASLVEVGALLMKYLEDQNSPLFAVFNAPDYRTRLENDYALYFSNCFHSELGCPISGGKMLYPILGERANSTPKGILVNSAAGLELPKVRMVFMPELPAIGGINIGTTFVLNISHLDGATRVEEAVKHPRYPVVVANETASAVLSLVEAQHNMQFDFREFGPGGVSREDINHQIGEFISYYASMDLGLPDAAETTISWLAKSSLYRVSKGDKVVPGYNYSIDFFEKAYADVTGRPFLEDARLFNKTSPGLKTLGQIVDPLVSKLSGEDKNKIVSKFRVGKKKIEMSIERQILSGLAYPP